MHIFSNDCTVPTISNPQCAPIQTPIYSDVNGVDASLYQWSATLENMPDGILEILLNNPSGSDGSGSTGVSKSSWLRRGWY